jgi:integrase
MATKSPAKMTDRWLSALKPRAERYEIAELGKAFGVRVAPSGLVTFVYRYRDRGRPRVLVLGRYGDAPPLLTLAAARKRYNAALAEVEAGNDPAARAVVERRATRGAPTVADLARDFLERHASQLRPATAREYARIVEREILPTLGPLKARDVARADVTALLDAVRDRIVRERLERAEARGEDEAAAPEPVMPNRVLAVLSAMYSWGVDKDLVPANPATGKRKPTPERHRDRHLTDAEVRHFWRGLDAARILPPLRLALRVLVLTGQRAGEVAGMAWSEIDLERATWTLPEARTKNGRRHVVPLAPAVLGLLRAALGASKGGPFVFHAHRVRRLREDGAEDAAAAKSRRLESHMKSAALSHALRENLAVLTLPGAEPFTPHTLRHTVATGLAALGMPRHVREAVLNHSQGGMAGHYDHHAYSDEKRAALEAWAAHVDGLLQRKDAR